MNSNMLTLGEAGFPEVLAQISNPPSHLFVEGPLSELLERPRVAVVGSRQMSIYGKQVTGQLATELAREGIVIVSGLAYGVDTAAHEACLQAGGQAIAVLPSPLDNIVPTANRQLARQIVANGGALVSEYSSGSELFRLNFIARNRLMSGLAQAVVITEAAAKSGARHTATFALDQGREVLAVPGNINSPSSAGANQLIKTGQAALVTEVSDVLRALKLEPTTAQNRRVRGSNSQEQTLLDIMRNGISDGHELLRQSGLTVPEYNQTLTMLEITGKIRPLGANHWGIL